MKRKILLLAIGLNLIVPGLGYIYMGRTLAGVLTFPFCFAVFLNLPKEHHLTFSIVLNVVMILDMAVLAYKDKKKVAAAFTKVCPKCAETIKKEAIVCRYCQTDLSENTPGLTMVRSENPAL